MIPEVFILMETSLRISRGILEGISDYVKANGPWKIRYTTGGMRDQRLPPGWRGDGVIGRVGTPELAAEIAAFNGPTVLFDLQGHYLAPTSPLSKMPRMMNDYAACGRMAAEFFLKRRYRNFAFFGPTYSSVAGLEHDGTGLVDPFWSIERRRGFEERLKRDGFVCANYPLPRSKALSANYSREAERVVKWIAARPKPLAILCAHDVRGIQVVDACTSVGIRVPEDVAVIGVNDDPIICSMCVPALTSIALDSRRAGYEAAKLLDMRMHGRHIPKETIYPPLFVDKRGSTAEFETSDPLISKAFAAITAAHGCGIYPDTIAKMLGISRRHLEKRFEKVVGAGVAATIRDIALDHAACLVTSTGKTATEIARESGIATAAHLAFLFRRRFGITMSDYRRTAREA
jgi:LacI family transcriptional regulator